MKNLDSLQLVLEEIKQEFIGKDEIIDLLGICLVARENMFLLGPPGTAKSAIIRRLSESIHNGNNFEYLLTRFTEPNELFGPFDIRKLKDGELETNTDGMMPEASLVFLDEIFNANSAILNSLLTALNERLFRRGKESKKLPALSFIGASNQLPEDETLAALLDRFLVRVKCGYVDPENLAAVLTAGWEMEKKSAQQIKTIDPLEIMKIQEDCKKVDIMAIRTEYVDIVHSLRNTGIQVSDRRAVKLQNLIAASALISGRQTAEISDFWVLKYIWDTEEQIEILEGMINLILEKASFKKAHPQAQKNKLPNAEELMKEIKFLSSSWDDAAVSNEQKNIIKDKLRFIHTRCTWVNNEAQKKLLVLEIDDLWKKILKSDQPV
ncbi:AAA family ATPase [Flavihumibacter sp. CACIAM 22H1]|uniref:AAA family ATPase n=1 Tax=Flavihumibacter sp. CACIAM 22H1 TaxID=1812911 RepID=UPI0007A8D2A3|nr:AAA family ATPase [Flavihumibacter sp. CACIAM 22H1]KYP15342.1 MAG: ATPase [Flavihumibacter sp. CACIAM 22H1]